MRQKFWNVVLKKDGEDQLDRCMYNDDVFHAVKEERNTLFTINLLVNAG
jgi:hypothetical protein